MHLRFAIVRGWSLALRSCLLGASWLLFCSVPPAGATSDEAVSQRLVPLGDATRGRDLFVEKGCLGCHSVGGVGGKLGPDLGRVPVRAGFPGLVAVLWSHIPAMHQEVEAKNEPLSFASPEEVRDLLTYVLMVRLTDKPGEAVAGRGDPGAQACYGCHLFAPRADAHRGKALFSSRCSGCHRKGGVGPDLRKTPAPRSPAHFAWAGWSRAPEMAKELASRGLEWPRLTGRELLDLLAFLRGD